MGIGGTVVRARNGLLSAAPLLRHPRYEVFPTRTVEGAVLEWVPRDMTVAVTASPGKGLAATLDLTQRLRAHGYRVVPHLSARLVVDDSHLTEIVARLAESGVDDIFVPGGDLDPPAGRFDSALSLLARLNELGHHFSHIGITGYPESHPKIVDDVTIQAMWDKRRYATYIVSNLCLNPAALRRWIERVRARGVMLPIFIGMTGPLDSARLMNMAVKAGARESARFLSGHAGSLLRLGMPGGYRPETFLDRLGPVLASPASAVAGLHLFTFNQVRQAEQWRSALVERCTGR